MDEKFMDIAIEISKNAKYPYGAIIVKDGEIIGRSDDDTLMSKTMYTHAELMAIESACKEVICDVNELAKCAKSNIEIVNEYKREEGLEVLKSYEF